MDKIELDAWNTSLLIKDVKKEGYGKLYARTNENLKELFSNFSVVDKDVLTVLASSDQYFYSYYLGAKSVDSFDCNKLTEYYYYLRRWIIEILGEFYLDTSKMRNSKFIEDILLEVNSILPDEKKAFKYWESYLKYVDYNLCRNLFYFGSKVNKPFIEDIEKLKVILKEKSLIFNHQDICGKVDKKRKYDVIIISNILEYIKYDSNALRCCRDNLENILKDDGKIICSYLLNAERYFYEIDIFSEKFNFFEFPSHSIKNYPVGYCYQKKQSCVLTKKG